MELEVLRFSSQKDSTSGILFDVVNGKRNFLCYTLEDEQRDVKVWGETRIPAGKYKLSLRKAGFQYILWHTGNTDENTAGCLLLGDSQTSNLVQKDGFVGSSVNAYKIVYPYVAAAIQQSDVWVTYIDYDGTINSNDTDSVQSNDILEKLEEISGEIQVVGAKLDKKVIL